MDKNEKMSELAESFLVLKGRAGTRPWNAELFARGMSGGQTWCEKQAAAFVLSVWNGGNYDDPWWCSGPYRVGQFDPVNAISRWDRDCTSAFIAWCQNPFFP